jgi:hypothetical protein
MTDKLQLGAIEIETNKYVSPTEALKGKNYKCIECDKKVIIRKGTIRKAHFAHYVQTNICTYYDHPNESQIHKDAKMLMAKLLTDKKSIQFIWRCDYKQCNTESYSYEFQEMPSIIYKEDDEVKMEYRDKDGKWVADVAIVNKGEVRYIIEIKNTHATTTVRPEPWYEIDASELIKEINTEHTDDPLTDEDKLKEDYIYYLCCQRTDIMRYCYGSFCYKEYWVDKIPGYDTGLILNDCILCKNHEYQPVCDGDTGRFKKEDGKIRVCKYCLFEDTTKKRLRKLYAPPCHGSCFDQRGDGYVQIKCPDSCELITCAKCPEKHPEWLLLCKGGLCIDCDMDKYFTTFLDVSYARKEEAKAMGAKWDPIKRKWYIHSNAKNKAIVLAKFKEIKQ